MTASRRAEYRIPCDDAAQAKRIELALRVETRDTPARTKVVVASEAETLLVTIEGDDTRGLRAATHSFLRWAQAAIDVDRTVSTSKNA